MQFLENFVKWLAVYHMAETFTAFSVFTLVVHFYEKKTPLPIVLVLMLLIVALLFFAVLAIEPTPISLWRVASVFFLYGTMLFVILSTLMQRGFAAWLTRKRGDKWVKELDYLYLTIGSIGVMGAANRIPYITGKIDSGDLLAPVAITTAIVILFIKTRAEIAGSNKPPTPSTSE